MDEGLREKIEKKVQFPLHGQLAFTGGACSLSNERYAVASKTEVFIFSVQKGKSNAVIKARETIESRAGFTFLYSESKLDPKFLLFSAHEDGSICAWSLMSSFLSKTVVLSSGVNNSKISCMAAFREGTRLIAATCDGTIYIIELDNSSGFVTTTLSLQKFKRDTQGQISLYPLKDDQFLVVSKGYCFLYDLKQEGKILKAQCSRRIHDMNMKIVPLLVGNQLLYATTGNSLSWLVISSLKGAFQPCHDWRNPGNEQISVLAFIPGQQSVDFIAVGFEEGSMKVLDPDGTCIKTINNAHDKKQPIQKILPSGITGRFISICENRLILWGTTIEGMMVLPFKIFGKLKKLNIFDGKDHFSDFKWKDIPYLSELKDICGEVAQAIVYSLEDFFFLPETNDPKAISNELLSIEDQFSYLSEIITGFSVLCSCAKESANLRFGDEGLIIEESEDKRRIEWTYKNTFLLTKEREGVHPDHPLMIANMLYLYNINGSIDGVLEGLANEMLKEHGLKRLFVEMFGDNERCIVSWDIDTKECPGTNYLNVMDSVHKKLTDKQYCLLFNCSRNILCRCDGRRPSKSNAFVEPWHFATEKFIDRDRLVNNVASRHPPLWLAVFDCGLDHGNKLIPFRIKGYRDAGISGLTLRDAGLENNTLDDRVGHGTEVSGVATAHYYGLLNGKENLMKLKNVKCAIAHNGKGLFSATAIDLSFIKLFRAIPQNEFCVINISMDQSNEEFYTTAFSSLRTEFKKSPQRKANTVIVMSAGNGFDNEGVDLIYNQALLDWLRNDVDLKDNVVIVGACDADGERCSFSNFGLDVVDILAPGTRILTITIPSVGKFVKFKDGMEGHVLKAGKCGTSYAAPLVAALLALQKCAFPESTIPRLIASIHNSDGKNVVKLGTLKCPVDPPSIVPPHDLASSRNDVSQHGDVPQVQIENSQGDSAFTTPTKILEKPSSGPSPDSVAGLLEFGPTSV